VLFRSPAGFRRVVLESSGFKGRGPAAQARALWQCLVGTRRALGLIRAFRPHLCFGAGGYVTVPVGLAAGLAGIPLVIHEQNSRPGLSNRVLGQLARKVLVGFDEARASFPAGKTVFTGNPVRPEIAALHEVRRDFQLPLTILVTGGSQGAAGLNRVAAPALAGLHRQGLSLAVVHQAGTDDLQWVRSVYGEAMVNAQVEEFFPNMADLYGRVDLVIARAGAITLAELTAARLPSLVVPLPTAADDHQTVNARTLAEAGAALVFPERTLTAGALAAAVADLAGDPARLTAMSRAAGEKAALGADEHAARICLELMGIPGESNRGAGRKR
jgi:UDP-N-acetylglucosamine--N-acetylmuramyl-(pentapeptide) pyrophosphoryl-undecaprenol N-acetylglucosamine transferase